MKDKSSFLQRLKEQTNEIHNQAHALAYFKSLMGGKVSIKSYLTQLHALAIIHATLEREIDKLFINYPEFTANGYKKKLPFLLADIEYLHSKTDERVLIEVIRSALKLVDAIMLSALKDPLLLLGYLYTLEGSLQGGEVVQKFIKKQFNLDDGKGMSYFTLYGSDTKKVWDSFKESFERIIISNNKEEEIIQSSLVTFEHLITIYSQIHLVNDEKLGYHSAAFNPEAGEMETPQDATLIEIAKKANALCLEQFPYFEFRYKERGYRFGLSDNLWFLTLLEKEYSVALSQSLWLIGLMARRGMPSFLLEKQLVILDEQLEKIQHPQNKEHPFAKIATHVRAQREAIMSDALTQSLVEKFEATTSKEYNTQLGNAAELIICSVLDEKIGYKNAIHSLKSFLCNRDIFSSDWIESVEQLYQEMEKQ